MGNAQQVGGGDKFAAVPKRHSRCHGFDVYAKGKKENAYANISMKQGITIHILIYSIKQKIIRLI
tara:strand:+ start:1320 stop:1514 length:195 start_codon:yes stop_codon:yes gene_type:complete